MSFKSQPLQQCYQITSLKQEKQRDRWMGRGEEEVKTAMTENDELAEIDCYVIYSKITLTLSHVVTVR